MAYSCIVSTGNSLYKPRTYCDLWTSLSACWSVAFVATQVPLFCSWASLMRYQTQTSIHQAHWWGQWGATASLKKALWCLCGIGRPCLQRLLVRGCLKQYTTSSLSALLHSALLPLGQLFGLFLSLWFSTTEPEEKYTCEVCTVGFKCACVCE